MFICEESVIRKAQDFFLNQHNIIRVGYVTLKNRQHAIKPLPKKTIDDICLGFKRAWGLSSYPVTYMNKTRIILFHDSRMTLKVPLRDILYDGIAFADRLVGIDEHLIEGDGLLSFHKDDFNNFSNRYLVYQKMLMENLGRLTYEELTPIVVVRNDNLKSTSYLNNNVLFGFFHDTASPSSLNKIKPLFSEEPPEYFVIARDNDNAHVTGVHDGILKMINDEYTALNTGPVASYVFDYLLQSKMEGPQFHLIENLYNTCFSGEIIFDLEIQETREQIFEDKIYYRICISSLPIWGTNNRVILHEIAEFINNVRIIKNFIPARLLKVAYIKDIQSIELSIDITDFDFNDEEKKVEFDASIKNQLSVFIQSFNHIQNMRLLTFSFGENITSIFGFTGPRNRFVQEPLF